MTQYLGFARNYGGDFFVMAWLTGNDAKQFDSWNNDDEHPRPNITLLNIPAVVTDGMCPYTAKEGRWIYVTMHLNMTTTYTRWSDVLGKLVRGQPSVVRTIRVTVRNEDSYIPLFFGRNGNLWLSNPKSNNKTPREDTMILNMVKVADKDGFPYTLQTKLTQYFPPLEARREDNEVPSSLPFKSKEAEDVQGKVQHKVSKVPAKKTPRKVIPWPLRGETQPHAVGNYSVNIPITVGEIITRPHPLSLSRFTEDEPRIEVVSHVRPEPFPEENQPRGDTFMDTDQQKDPRPRHVEESFDNYQATLPDPEDEDMDEDQSDALSHKATSITSSSKSLTSPSISDTFTPSPISQDGARALPLSPRITRSQSMPAKPQPNVQIPPSVPISFTLLHVIPEAQSTPNTSTGDEDSSTSKHSTASTIPLAPVSPRRRISPFRKPVFDTLSDDHVNVVTPGLLNLQPALAPLFAPRIDPPISPGLYQRATLPLPGVLGPDLPTPSTSREYSTDLSVSKDASEPSPSSTKNNPPSKIRFVPDNPEVYTSEIICPDSPIHREGSPNFAQEYDIADYIPMLEDEDNDQEEPKRMSDHDQEEPQGTRRGEKEKRPRRGEKEKRPHK